MSSAGGPPSESLDSSGLPIPDGGGSTSVLASCRPFKVSFMASNECSMRASLGDGGGDDSGVSGACNDAPLPQFPRVLTILYDLTCINQSCQGEFKDISNRCYFKLRNRVRRKFSLLVYKHTLLL